MTSGDARHAALYSRRCNEGREAHARRAILRRRSRGGGGSAAVPSGAARRSAAAFIRASRAACEIDVYERTHESAPARGGDANARR